jgi:hypothetical protein
MTPLPLNVETEALARRIVWFEEPAQALADPIRFLAYLMTYATVEDLRVAGRYLDNAAFREALEEAPPGIIDARSWSYWHARFGCFPAPPMPRRRLG